MLEIAIGAFVIALIAGALGFTGVARTAGAVAKVVFAVFLIIAVLFFVLVALGISILV